MLHYQSLMTPTIQLNLSSKTPLCSRAINRGRTCPTGRNVAWKKRKSLSGQPLLPRGSTPPRPPRCARHHHLAPTAPVVRRVISIMRRRAPEASDLYQRWSHPLENRTHAILAHVQQSWLTASKGQHTPCVSRSGCQLSAEDETISITLVQAAWFVKGTSSLPWHSNAGTAVTRCIAPALNQR